MPVYLLDQQPRVWRGRLSPGHAGTAQTLRLMRALVREGARDLRIRNTAVGVIRGAGVAAHDFLGELAALYGFVRDRVRFTRDPVGVELLQGAVVTLERGAGDCDDKATLLGALLEAVGHPAELRFRAIGVTPARQFQHVYVVARLAGREIALDPTFARTPMGWQLRRPSIVRDFPLWAT